MEKLISKLDYEGIKENYDKWISIISTEIVNGKVNNYLTEKQYDYLIENLIHIIVSKMNDGDSINRMEAEVFIYSLICFVLYELNIHSLASYSYIKPDNKRFMDDWNGLCLNSKNNGIYVFYNEDVINNFYDSDIMLDERLLSLTTICHELVHVKQLQDKKEGVITLDNYVMTLEGVVALDSCGMSVEEALNKDNFYFGNYAYTREEIDANGRAIDLLFDFYKKYNVYDEGVIDEFKKHMKLIAEYETYNANVHNVVIDGVSENVRIEYYSLLKTCEYVATNKDLLKEFPLLRLIFNEDGKLYSITELLDNRKNLFNKVLDVSELDKVYDYIIKTYQIFMTKEEIEKEIRLYFDNNSCLDDYIRSLLDGGFEYDDMEQMKKLECDVKKRLLKLGLEEDGWIKTS